MSDGFAGYRARLVDQLRARGYEDLAILRAFGITPRHLFVPDALQSRAYEDAALPVGRGQTISQPSTHAAYLQALALRGTERVLEVGTGTGYQAALLACLAPQVFTVERVANLAGQAQRALIKAGVTNVTVLIGDGTLGWRPYAPYDAVLVAAAGPQVPPPLLDQLTDGGRLVMPLQGLDAQELIRVTRTGADYRTEQLGPVSFVPLIGRHGFDRGTV